MVFYFSSTGNTRWAARKISEALGETLVSIPEALCGDCSYEIDPGETLGICFPVHAWRIPKIVREFLSRLSLKDIATDTYAFALMTAGDDTGECLRLIREALAAKGLRLQAAMSLIMPESYVGLPMMDVDKPTREQEKKAESKALLESWTEDLRQRRPVITHICESRWPKINTRILGALFDRLLITDRPFHAVAGRCIKCGKCASVCPVSDIDGGRGKIPVWKHNGRCLTCFSCYHHCPTHAIEYGLRTAHKGQYYFSRRPASQVRLNSTPTQDKV